MLQSTMYRNFIIHGQDRFLINNQKQKIIAQIKKKHPDINLKIYNFDQAEQTADELIQEISLASQSLSLFATPQVIVLNDPLKNKVEREKIIELFRNNKINYLILVEDSTILQHTAFFKKFDSKTTQFHSFSIPKQGLAKIKYIEKTAQELLQTNQIKLKNNQTFKELLSCSYVSDNNRLEFSFGLWQQNLNKLKLLNKKLIEQQDVENQLKENQPTDIWALTSIMFSQYKSSKYTILNQLLLQKTDPIFILNTLADQIRTLIVVKELKDKSQSQSQIQQQLSKMGKNPNVIYYIVKNINLETISLNKLVLAFRKITQLDWKIKKGEVEPEVALNLILLRI